MRWPPSPPLLTPGAGSTLLYSDVARRARPPSPPRSLARSHPPKSFSLFEERRISCSSATAAALVDPSLGPSASTRDSNSLYLSLSLLVTAALERIANDGHMATVGAGQKFAFGVASPTLPPTKDSRATDHPSNPLPSLW